MIAMLALWTLLTSQLLVEYNDGRYPLCRPRTFQVDAVVGHNDSAQIPAILIAINLNSRIEIIEFPGAMGQGLVSILDHSCSGRRGPGSSNTQLCDVTVITNRI